MLVVGQGCKSIREAEALARSVNRILRRSAVPQSVLRHMSHDPDVEIRRRPNDCGWLSESAERWRSENNWHGSCVSFSRASPSNPWWRTTAGQEALSRPTVAEGGGRRPAFTGLLAPDHPRPPRPTAGLGDGLLRHFSADSRRRQQRPRFM
jgi:hypothetical protein